MSLKTLLASATLAAMPLVTLAAPQLVMVEQHGCVYCERWDAEIAPAYPKTAEGKFAPLKRVDIRDTGNGEITYDRRVSFTPTFVLVENGKELARIEGYPGEDFFWPLFNRLLVDYTAFDADSAVTN